MADRITSYDVARLAGVSRTTVSMVLNRSDAVTLAQETRDRVFKAAAELGYRPNSAARMLVRGNTETIGLVISDPAILPIDGFIPQLLHGIGKVNRAHGFHVLLEGLDPEAGAGAYDALVETRRIDGLIVLNPRTEDPGLVSLIERDFPLVLVGSIRHPDEFSVNFSSREATEDAVQLLYDLGHRRIGSVTFSPKGFMATDARLAGLRNALASRGIDMPEDAVDYGDFSAASGHAAALRLLQRRPDLTAVFAGNDTIAIGVISAAAALGRRVPEDLSIIGFDDLPFAAWLTPALTTLRVDAIHQGSLAAEMLIQRLTGASIAKRRMRLRAELIVRQSCVPARPA